MAKGYEQQDAHLHTVGQAEAAIALRPFWRQRWQVCMDEARAFAAQGKRRWTADRLTVAAHYRRKMSTALAGSAS